MEKVKKHDVYYNSEMNCTTYNVDGQSVASLDHDTDELETYTEMTDADKDFYYTEMQKEKYASVGFAYDVKEEQGIYSYGY